MIPRLAYGLVRSLARFLLAVFYGRIEVAGAERTPGTGPLIVAANHHNPLVDAMLLLAIVPRRLSATPSSSPRPRPRCAREGRS